MNLDQLEIFQKNFLKAVTKNEDAPLEIIPIRDLNQQNVIQIYQTDYNARLIEALGDRYETIWAVIGDEDFFEMAKLYIKNYPSDKTDLGSYGEHFPLFLKENYPDKEFNFLKDIAEFEVNFWKVFHSAPESFDFDWSQYTQELETSSFEFTQNSNIFIWEVPIYDLFKNRKENLSDLEIDLEKEQSVLIYKNQSQVKIKELLPDEFQLITLLTQGKTIQNIIETENFNVETITNVFNFLSHEKLIKLIL